MVKENSEKEFVEKVDSEAKRKLKAREKSEIMFGLGTFGIIGWSISVPAILGVLLGQFLDKKFALGFSWTLTLLFIGVVVGCINAWHWIAKKSGRR